MSTLARVIDAVDPALAEFATEDPGPDRFAALQLDPERLFVLEAVYEGYLMHYGQPRAFSGMDPDMRLLAGDALYALGLSRLAQLGDLAAVAELSDLISLSARAHVEGHPGRTPALWLASARRLAGEAGPRARETWREAGDCDARSQVDLSPPPQLNT